VSARTLPWDPSGMFGRINLAIRQSPRKYVWERLESENENTKLLVPAEKKL
jgi:hypothetical protein